MKRRRIAMKRAAKRSQSESNLVFPAKERRQQRRTIVMKKWKTLMKKMENKEKKSL